MRRLPFLAVVATLLLPAEARAWDFRLSSSTHLSGRVLPGPSDPSTHLPLTEFIRLRASDLGLEGLSVQTSVWGQVDFLDNFDDRVTGDVTTLLLEYAAPEESTLAGLQIRLGRQFVSAGPSVLEQLDGARVSYLLPMGLQLAAFGGVPTGIRFVRQPWIMGVHGDQYGDNWVVGGRLGYRLGDKLGVGASYRHKRHRGLVAHHEVGWDLTAAPLSWLELLCDGAVELTVERLKQLRAAVLLHPTRDLDLEAGYRLVSPDLYVPRSSIFAVFSDGVHQRAYVEGYWSRWRWLELSLEVGLRVYEEACSEVGGKTTCDEAAVVPGAALRAVLRMGPERLHRVVAEAQRVGTSDGGLTRFRVGSRMPLFSRLSLAVDLDVYLLDEIRGEDNGNTSWSFAGSGYLSYELPRNFSIMAGGGGMVTPVFSNAASFLVRLNWFIDRPAPASKVAVQRSAAKAVGGGVL